MAYRVVMFLLGLTEDFSSGMFTVLVAVWFMSIGYLLVKNVNRRARARTERLVTCVAGEPFLDTRHEEALLRG